MCNVMLIILHETGMPVSSTIGHMPYHLAVTLCGAYSSLIFQTLQLRTVHLFIEQPL